MLHFFFTRLEEEYNPDYEAIARILNQKTRSGFMPSCQPRKPDSRKINDYLDGKRRIYSQFLMNRRDDVLRSAYQTHAFSANPSRSVGSKRQWVDDSRGADIGNFIKK